MLFVLFILPSVGHATEILLTPSNLHEVVAKINYLYGDLIAISPEQLKSFLQDAQETNYDPQLEAPSPSIALINDDHIGFSWNAIPDALNYQTQYLDLKTGETDSKNAPETSAKFTVPNGLHLFIFATLSAKNIGPQWIIIEDKPLAFSYNTLFNCSCIEPEVIHTTAITPEPTPIFQYIDGIADNPVLRIKMNFSDDTGEKFSANFSAKLLIDELGAITNVVLPYDPENSFCLQNIESDFSYLWAMDYGMSVFGQPEAIRFDFTGPSMKVKALDEMYTGSIQIERCWVVDNSEKRGDANGLASKAQVYPNPNTGIFSLTLHETPENIPPHFTLTNQYGQAIALKGAMIAPSLWQFDLGDHPDGLYWLQVASAPQPEIYPIVKIAY